jgi:hypothetical protein
MHQTRGRRGGYRGNHVQIETLLRLSDGKTIPAIITRLSADGSGCRISIRAVLPVGEAVELAISGRGRSLAYVRWSTANKASLLFVVPLAVS